MRGNDVTAYVNYVILASGNFLVIVTVIVVFSKPIDVTNLFIVSLATADFLVSSFVAPFRVSPP